MRDYLRGGGGVVCLLAAMAVMVSPRPIAAQSDSIRVSIGASFDFLNKVSATDLYGDVEVFLPGLWAEGKIGVEAGLYNGRTTSRSDTVPDARAYAGIPDGAGMMTVVRQTFTRVQSGHEDRLGLYAGVLATVAPSLYLTGQAEVLQRERTTVFSDTLTATDTLGVEALADSTLLDGGVVRRLNSRLIRPGSRSFPGTTWQSLFSVGVVVRHQFAGAELQLKPLIGVGAINGNAEGLFSVRFAVRSLEHGFKIGGDVRGRLDGNGETTVLVYLAKTFTLKRLAEFIGS